MKCLSTETVSCVGLDALESSSILVTTYSELLLLRGPHQVPVLKKHINKEQEKSLQPERQGKNICTWSAP